MSSGGTVLVVDDEPSLRMLCRVNLEFARYTVHEAATLAEARVALEVGDVELVVHIAGEDGRDLLDELRASESPTRVVMLTGSSDLQGRRMQSADAVLAKPFDPEELVRVVGQLLNGAPIDSTT